MNASLSSDDLSSSEPSVDYGEGGGYREHTISPWEDRQFWEHRAADSNHFYQTSESFASSSGMDLSEIDSVEEEEGEDVRGDDDADNYQVMVERAVDGTYQVSTNETKMDENVRKMCFDTSSDVKQKDASIFRKHDNAKPMSKSVESMPSIALSATSSSEWSADGDYVYTKDTKIVSSRSKSNSRALLLPFCIIVVFALGAMIATNNAAGIKLTATLIDETTVHKGIVHAVDEHHDIITSHAVEGITSKGSDDVLPRIIIELISFIKDLTDLKLWRSRTADVLSGAIPTSWVS